MHARTLLRPLAALVVAMGVVSCRGGGGGPSEGGAPLKRFDRTRQALGTTFRLTVYAGDATVAGVALGAAGERLDALDATLNGERPESEVAAVNAAAGGSPVRVSDELFAVLVEARRLAQDTNGAFDVTAGAFRDLWRRAAEERRSPTEAELSNAKLLVGWQHLRLDAIEHTASLTLPGMRLDLAGIVHGHAADEVIRELRRYGCERAAVSGGNVRVVGAPPPGRNGWRVKMGAAGAPAAPAAMEVSNTGVAFSPNARTGRGGRGVLIDPKSGRVLNDRAAVVVFSRRGGAAAEGFAAAAAVVGDPNSNVLTQAARGARFRFGPARRGRGE